MFVFSLQVFQESEAHFAGISLLSSSPANWSHMSCHGCAAIQWHVNRRSPVRNPEGCNLSWESWPWCCNLTALQQYSPLDQLVHAVRLSSNSYKGFGRGFIFMTPWRLWDLQNSIYSYCKKKQVMIPKFQCTSPPNHPNLDYSSIF